MSFPPLSGGISSLEYKYDSLPQPFAFLRGLVTNIVDKSIDTAELRQAHRLKRVIDAERARNSVRVQTDTVEQCVEGHEQVTCVHPFADDANMLAIGTNSGVVRIVHKSNASTHTLCVVKITNGMAITSLSVAQVPPVPPACNSPIVLWNDTTKSQHNDENVRAEAKRIDAIAHVARCLSEFGAKTQVYISTGTSLFSDQNAPLNTTDNDEIHPNVLKYYHLCCVCEGGRVFSTYIVCNRVLSRESCNTLMISEHILTETQTLSSQRASDEAKSKPAHAHTRTHSRQPQHHQHLEQDSSDEQLLTVEKCFAEAVIGCHTSDSQSGFCGYARIPSVQNHTSQSQSTSHSVVIRFREVATSHENIAQLVTLCSVVREYKLPPSVHPTKVAPRGYTLNHSPCGRFVSVCAVRNGTVAIFRQGWSVQSQKLPTDCKQPSRTQEQQVTSSCKTTPLQKLTGFEQDLCYCVESNSLAQILSDASMRVCYCSPDHIYTHTGTAAQFVRGGWNDECNVASYGINMHVWYRFVWHSDLHLLVCAAPPDLVARKRSAQVTQALGGGRQIVKRVAQRYKNYRTLIWDLHLRDVQMRRAEHDADVNTDNSGVMSDLYELDVEFLSCARVVQCAMALVTQIALTPPTVHFRYSDTDSVTKSCANDSCGVDGVYRFIDAQSQCDISAYTLRSSSFPTVEIIWPDADRMYALSLDVNVAHPFQYFGLPGWELNDLNSIRREWSALKSESDDPIGEMKQQQQQQQQPSQDAHLHSRLQSGMALLNPTALTRPASSTSIASSIPSTPAHNASKLASQSDTLAASEAVGIPTGISVSCITGFTADFAVPSSLLSTSVVTSTASSVTPSVFGKTGNTFQGVRGGVVMSGDNTAQNNTHAVTIPLHVLLNWGLPGMTCAIGGAVQIVSSMSVGAKSHSRPGSRASTSSIHGGSSLQTPSVFRRHRKRHSRSGTLSTLSSGGTTSIFSQSTTALVHKKFRKPNLPPSPHSLKYALSAVLWRRRGLICAEVASEADASKDQHKPFASAKPDAPAHSRKKSSSVHAHSKKARPASMHAVPAVTQSEAAPVVRHVGLNAFSSWSVVGESVAGVAHCGDLCVFVTRNGAVMLRVVSEDSVFTLLKGHPEVITTPEDTPKVHTNETTSEEKDQWACSLSVARTSVRRMVTHGTQHGHVCFIGTERDETWHLIVFSRNADRSTDGENSQNNARTCTRYMVFDMHRVLHSVCGKQTRATDDQASLARTLLPAPYPGAVFSHERSLGRAVPAETGQEVHTFGANQLTRAAEIVTTTITFAAPPVESDSAIPRGLGALTGVSPGVNLVTTSESHVRADEQRRGALYSRLFSGQARQRTPLEAKQSVAANEGAGWRVEAMENSLRETSSGLVCSVGTQSEADSDLYRSGVLFGIVHQVCAAGRFFLCRVSLQEKQDYVPFLVLIEPTSCQVLKHIPLLPMVSKDGVLVRCSQHSLSMNVHQRDGVISVLLSYMEQPTCPPAPAKKCVEECKDTSPSPQEDEVSANAMRAIVPALQHVTRIVEFSVGN